MKNSCYHKWIWVDFDGGHVVVCLQCGQPKDDQC